MNQSTRAVRAASDLLRGETGLKVSLEQIQSRRGDLHREAVFEVEARHWGTKVPERTPTARTPRIAVFLRKLTAGKSEKLGAAAVTAELGMELQVTHERADDLQILLNDCVDGVCDVLARNQGLWGHGAYYAGGYEVEISPIAKGGLNYVQSANVTLQIHLWQE
jgi:hypothetical protein